MEPDGVRVDDLAAVVVVDRLADGERSVDVALAVEVEVRDDVLGGERGAVGVGHVGADVERVLGRVGVHLGQRRRDPRLELERLRVLPEQPVGDVVDDGAVRVEAGGRRVERRPGLRLEVGERAAGLRFAARRLIPSAARRAARQQSGRRDEGGEGDDGAGRTRHGSAPACAVRGWVRRLQHACRVFAGPRNTRRNGVQRGVMRGMPPACSPLRRRRDASPPSAPLPDADAL